MKHLKRFNEIVETDGIKFNLESLFPEIKNLEKIGSGQLGHAYLGTIGNDLVVVKMTNSTSEYYMSKLAMISNPPNTVKFHVVKVFDKSKFLYGIVHDYVSRDAMPDKDTWDLARRAVDGKVAQEVLDKRLKTREQKYEFNIIKNKIKELEDHFFGVEIDTLWQNWGYDSDRNLVIFDLDGNMSKPKYEQFLKKYQ